jgi:hypothetical protein
MLFLVDDTEGVKDLTQRKLSQRELAERVHNVNSDPTTVMADIPLDYGRFILHQAVRLNEEKRVPLPQGFGDAFKYVGLPESDWPRSPFYDHVDADSVRKDESVSRAPEKLFEIPVFEGWLLPFDEIESWEEKYFEAVSSRVLIDEAQRARRGDAIVEEAVDALMTPERILRYRRRLEDTAYVLQLAGREAEARQTLYHALTCDESAKPRSIPFLRTLVHRSIYLVIAYKAQLEEQAARANPPGLIQRV